MTRLLLDHPWPLHTTLVGSSDGFMVFQKFIELLRQQDIPFESIVPFIDQLEHNNAIQQLKGKGTVAATIRRHLRHFIRYADNTALATPIQEPKLPHLPLSDCWKRALRDELEYPENWRNPQIIFPRVRQKAWPKADEIEIKCGDREATVFRVFASIEGYESHKYAISNIDPWRNLEWLKQPEPDARVDYPCRLPRPPILKGVPIEQLPEMLAEARRIGWKVEGNYYFIPREDFNPALVDQHVWRKGSAFKLDTKNTVKGKKTGPVDYEGRIWSFDIHGERHWDVQLPDGGKLDISHDGHLVHPS